MVVSQEGVQAQGKKTERTSVDLLIFIFLAAVLGLLLLIYLVNSKKIKPGVFTGSPISTRTTLISPTAVPKNIALNTVPTVEPSPTAIPTPTRVPKAIPHGSGGFTVSMGDAKGPRIGGGKIDPYDPTPGQQQRFSIDVAYTAPVTSVTVTVNTDSKTPHTYPLALASGTTLNGTWSGSWTIEDPYLYNYSFTIIANSRSGMSTVTNALR